MKLFAEIQKVDEDLRLVYGYASTEAVDSQKEVVKREAMEAALLPYMKFANIREMHKPSAVGIAHDAQVDDKGLYLTAKVVDDSAWEKVKAGVYKGFSIGGKATSRDPLNKYIITGMDLTEISLVDRPANPEAVFDFYKVDDGDTTDEVPLEEPAGAGTSIASQPTVDPVDQPASDPVPAAEPAQASAKAVDATTNGVASTVEGLAKLEAAPADAAVEKADGLQDSDVMSAMAADHRAKARAHMANAADMRAVADEPGARSEEARADAHNGAAMHLEFAASQMKTIGKGDVVADVAKRGAKLSAADQAKMNAMHDMAVELGGVCPASMKADGIAAADDQIEKTEDLLQKRMDALVAENHILKAERAVVDAEKSDLVAKVDGLQVEVETLKKLPADALAAPVLKSLDKAEDVLTNHTVAKAAPTEQHDKWFGFNPNGTKPSN